MSHRTKLQKLLKKSGFKLIRKSKHFVYRNEAGNTVIIPNHNKMNNNTFKKIKKEIEDFPDFPPPVA